MSVTVATIQVVNKTYEVHVKYTALERNIAVHVGERVLNNDTT